MRFETMVNNTRPTGYHNKPAFINHGFGQVEPNHLSAQRTGQIYAQLPAAADIDILEQGQFVKYDYANGVVNFDGPGEWMLVFNEIKLYREGQRDCEFAMIKDNYNARIYSPYGEDKAGGQSRYYNGRDAEGNTSYTMRPAEYALTTDVALNSNKTYYTKNGDTYTAVASPVVDNIGTYYEMTKAAETYAYDKVTVNPNLDIYEMFGTDDPFHIIPGYKEKKMPEGTKMVPRVFKTNVGDIFTTNTIDAETLHVEDVLCPRVADGILVSKDSDDETDDTMIWQVVKVYTMPDGQPGVKIMRIA